MISNSRQLSDLDYLLGVDDFSRVGALRFAPEGKSPESIVEGRRRTPTLLDLSKIYSATRRVELDEETADDLKYLEGKGTSLGGARPKCSIIDPSGNLYIGKFPSQEDRRNVVKGEILGLKLAEAAGIDAATGHVIRIDGTDIAVIKRFDRNDNDDLRIPLMQTYQIFHPGNLLRSW